MLQTKYYSDLQKSKSVHTVFIASLVEKKRFKLFLVLLYNQLL
jgi:hypothetical protein